MSDTPKKLIIDLETKTERYVDYTPEELSQREIDMAAAAAELAAREAKEEAKAQAKAAALAKLAALGLTEEEAAAL